LPETFVGILLERFTTYGNYCFNGFNALISVFCRLWFDYSKMTSVSFYSSELYDLFSFGGGSESSAFE